MPTPTNDQMWQEIQGLLGRVRRLEGNRGTTTGFYSATKDPLAPGTGGVNGLAWNRIGDRVFVDFSWVTGSSGQSLGTLTDTTQLHLPFPVSQTKYAVVAGDTARAGFVQTNLWDGTALRSDPAIMDFNNNTRVIYFDPVTRTVGVATNTLLNSAGAALIGFGFYFTDAA